MQTTWEYGDSYVIKTWESDCDFVSYTLCDFSSDKESQGFILDSASQEDDEEIIRIDYMLDEQVNPYEIFKEYLSYQA